MTSKHAWRLRSVISLLGVGAMLVVAACGSTSSGSGPKVTKTTATFAEGPGAQPNYIFPLASLAVFQRREPQPVPVPHVPAAVLVRRNGTVALNNSLSLADPPVYSSDGKSVTITLKGWKWSDGTQITARDVQFWQNLVTANKDNWAGYSPGEYPDNVLSTTISPTNPLQITFNLSQAYGSYFFTYNELSQITPLPQHVWDKESATGAVGDYDTTPAGAQAVFKFLDAQSKSISTYDTNPLWQVDSGPWKLKSMDTAGNVSMVPNTELRRTHQADPDAVQRSPVHTGHRRVQRAQVGDVGRPTPPSTTAIFRPATSPEKSTLDNVYNFEPWTGWQITYFPENFTNPTSGPIFSQLYFRQAMQDLVDQNTFINKAFFGYAYPTYGPVPVKPILELRRLVREVQPVSVQPEHGGVAAPGQRLDGQSGRHEHLHEPGHRHGPVRRRRQARRQGFVQPPVRERHARTRPGDGAVQVGLRAGGHRDRPDNRTVRHGHRQRDALQGRVGVHLGHGVLGRWLDLRT